MRQRHDGQCASEADRGGCSSIKEAAPRSASIRITVWKNQIWGVVAAVVAVGGSRQGKRVARGWAEILTVRVECLLDMLVEVAVTEHSDAALVTTLAHGRGRDEGQAEEGGQDNLPQHVSRWRPRHWL